MATVTTKVCDLCGKSDNVRGISVIVSAHDDNGNATELFGSLRDKCEKCATRAVNFAERGAMSIEEHKTKTAERLAEKTKGTNNDETTNANNDDEQEAE